MNIEVDIDWTNRSNFKDEGWMVINDLIDVVTRSIRNGFAPRLEECLMTSNKSDCDDVFKVVQITHYSDKIVFDLGIT